MTTPSNLSNEIEKILSEYFNDDAPATEEGSHNLATQALTTLFNKQIVAELKHLYGFQGAFISEPIRKQIEDRIKELE